MKRIAIVGLALCGGIMLAAGVAAAGVWMPAMFGRNMVLQRDRPLPVWGTASPGETVTVTVGNRQACAIADKLGAWRVTLDALKASNAPLTMTVAGADSSLTFSNVLVGEVWICSGQSNMEKPVNSASNGVAEAAAPVPAGIRLFVVKKAAAPVPQPDVEGSWVVPWRESVGYFSAVGYFFAREVHKALGVPVGMINASFGATPAEAWTSRGALEADPALAPMVAQGDERAMNVAPARAQFEKQLKEWEAAQAQPAAGSPAAYKPTWIEPGRQPYRPANLFNAMVAPLIPYAVRGALWYQGEANDERPAQYATLFPTLIRDWRTRWHSGDFPFLFVQLAGFDQADWPWIREAQARALDLPDTGMAVAIDVGDKTDIHPKNKQAVAHRLAVLALHDVYHLDNVACHGPEYLSMKVDGDHVRLRFRHAEGGLTSSTTAALPFVIADQDRVFVPAQSKIEGSEVVVWSDKVQSPKAVRYAWTGFVETGYLYNNVPLPMPPFRTDDWPSDIKEPTTKGM